MTKSLLTESGYISVLDLIEPVLDAIEDLGGSANNDEIDDHVAGALNLSEDERNALHQGGPQTKLAYRIAWTRSWLKKAGLLENSQRRVWSLTATAHDWRVMPKEVLIDLVRSANRSAKSPAKSSGMGKVDVDLGGAENEGEDSSWRELLLARLLELEPSAFERLCQRLLRESGFTRVEVTGKSGDGGIDGTGVLRMNLLSFQVIFQCKRWQGSVGASTVQDFRGAMVGRADKGLIITTGTFTGDARKKATRDGAPAIDLVDGETLCDLLKERRLGVKVEMVEEVTLDEAAFADF